MTTPDSSAAPPPTAIWPQTLVGIGVFLTGLALAFGAIGISSEAGYGGVGPNFLPWLVSGVLTLCGGWILWEARTGGFRELDAPSGAEHAYWPGFVWVSAGLLLNAALITTLGFILSCTLCYVLAVQGLRRASGQPSANQPRTWAIDLLTGALISAPVFWMFTKFLAINLPGLTTTGWI
ncbi:tripartite tricarboxylate transporter TctB family protein [Variovorax sp. V59]|uniref:Tricarboxylic transport membrane protein n=2 Tax=Variovorax TaxID=34072 RepID=A0AAE3Y114_VARPD|nr:MULTISPECIES: tripartite tricarboxylate transporter TctB family protein [Variovorax]MBD9664018.1 tripartite tricarboxylate transporter TctB family protein [Variovorax sp. VRV01]MDP9964895.1 putative tricarboxylic transport membrane protein [Variovorax paradoxus]MDR6428604.1 putative tricarboxylic transport membrane protein [Variovorax paradoxus]MDR6455258.1 putative tricarboxylic transport membrane protein [Variovorax paradoxus]TWD85254.1 putative tricarboxylic transport membrane protein [V